MQVYTSKNILLLFFLFILPIGLFAQIGTRKYITRSGDTTVIVNPGRTGLSGEDARFLHDERAIDDEFSKLSRFRMLKEAAQETGQVAKIVEVEQKEVNPSSGSLGFRIAQKNIRYLQNEQKATRMARDIANKDASIEELLFLKEKYGGKPSYFVNGVHVDAQTAALLSDKDIMTRSLRVANTATGNPNGEVWYVVNTKVFEKLGLADYTMPEVNYASSDKSSNQREEQSVFDIDVKTRESPISPNEYKQLSSTQQQTLSSQQREVEELRRQIEEVKRQRAAISNKSNEPQTPAYSYSEEPVPNNNRVTTPTPTYPTNKRYQEPAEEIIGFRDSPQERTRRERDRLQESESDNDAPKRSVRRIKDRERSR